MKLHGLNVLFELAAQSFSPEAINSLMTYLYNGVAIAPGRVAPLWAYKSSNEQLLPPYWGSICEGRNLRWMHAINNHCKQQPLAKTACNPVACNSVHDTVRPMTEGVVCTTVRSVRVKQLNCRWTCCACPPVVARMVQGGLPDECWGWGVVEADGAGGSWNG